MAITKRHGNWHYRFEFQGRSYRASTGLAATARNRTAAAKTESDARQALREGHDPRPTIHVALFSDAAREYLQAMDAAHRERPNTARRLRVSFASLAAHFGRQPVSSVGAGAVEAYKTWRINVGHVRDVTLRHDLHALSNFYRWAERHDYCVHNPVLRVKIPSDKDAVRMHVLSAEEERVYFVAAAGDPLLHDFGRILLAQGMRPDELLSLRPEDVDLLAAKLHIRRAKTSAGRRALAMTDETRSILAHRISVAADLWPGKMPGRRASYSGIVNRHLRALKASGTAFVLYDLRHTFATRMAEAGCPLATLASLLGHASLRICERYIHPSAAHQEQAMHRYGDANRPAEARPQ